jgi:O-antigen/teichoic acid export membrane protein
MLAMITVLARKLGLSEFGVYGLFVSVASYLLIVQLSIEGAAVRAIAAAREAAERERVFSTAVWLYAAAGLGAGIIVAVVGLLLAGVLGIPDHLRPAARAGILMLAALIALGWPAKAFQDLLRGQQLFGAAALGDMLAYAVVSGTVIALALAEAPLSLVIAAGGALSAASGLGALAIARVFRVTIPYRSGAADRAMARELLGVSGFLLVTGIADLVIYSMDRVILAAYKGAAAVGLYEGAVRPQNMLRQLQGTLALTVSPVAAGFRAQDDDYRQRELLIRGTRYVVAIVAPVATILIVLAAPILEVWLGDRFRGAAGALRILASYWIIGGVTGVMSSMFVAAGRVRALAAYASAVAVANLATSLILTPSLGLKGIAIAIAAPAALGSPYFMRIATEEFGVRFSELARGALVPAYATSGVMAVGLLLVRNAVDPHTLVAVALLAGGAFAAVLLAYWLIWFDEAERRLVKGLLGRAG